MSPRLRTGAFGGVRKQWRTAPLQEATDSAIGGALGVDRQIAPDLKLGVFAGGGTGRAAGDSSSQSADTDYVFGGGYGRYEWAAQFLDVILYGGHAHNSTSRTVVSNAAAGGVETATRQIRRALHQPGHRLWVARAVGCELHAARLTARLRYVGGFFDGYSETGSAQRTSRSAAARSTTSSQRFKLDVTRSAVFGAHDAEDTDRLCRRH